MSLLIRSDITEKNHGFLGLAKYSTKSKETPSTIGTHVLRDENNNLDFGSNGVVPNENKDDDADSSANNPENRQQSAIANGSDDDKERDMSTFESMLCYLPYHTLTNTVVL